MTKLQAVREILIESKLVHEALVTLGLSQEEITEVETWLEYRDLDTKELRER